MSKYIDAISSPAELRAIPENEMPAVCEEYRAFLIENAKEHGGHLASNLGVVELSVALHRIFDSPKDHIIFDVGHQAYVHKLITGRKSGFSTLRKPGGLSGFTSRAESEHDPFGAGHSSTSVSAALGFAVADKLAGREAFTVCVLGDGAYTGGMIHEAMNNCRPDLPMIIILNENRMSISKNQGAFASYLSGVRLSRKYRRFKRGTKSFLAHLPLIGKPLTRLFSGFKSLVKRVVYKSNYFESLGLTYLGPVVGNDYAALSNALLEAKEIGRTVVLHIETVKGKGYSLAEEHPEAFHSVSHKESSESFHSVFAGSLATHASQNERVVAVTAAMGIGTGLASFGEQYPSRYFDVGIAEPHALTFAAGLSAAGMVPYVAIYSTFLQRGYDNILHDIALQNLPVHLMIDRAGLAVSDGATHHGIFDVAFLSHIPGISIYAPATFGSLRAILEKTKDAKAPVAIRYPNAAESPLVRDTFYKDGDYESFGVRANFESGKTLEVLFITYGQIAERVLSAEVILSAEGISCGTILLEALAPYEKTAERLRPYLADAERVIFVEEGIKNGGAGMILSTLLPEKKITVAAIANGFAKPASPCDLYDFVGLSPARLAALAHRLLEK
ncbi:MAG: 1-deoxy-D-xylulose-5-phosphate synthase [Clostridia bacterium]|nr:1-deoxy-D-xylulose-5-phosphate synthase [Clostridia bacterium]